MPNKPYTQLSGANIHNSSKTIEDKLDLIAAVVTGNIVDGVIYDKHNNPILKQKITSTSRKTTKLNTKEDNNE